MSGYRVWYWLGFNQCCSITSFSIGIQSLPHTLVMSEARRMARSPALPASYHLLHVAFQSLFFGRSRRSFIQHSCLCILTWIVLQFTKWFMKVQKYDISYIFINTRPVVNGEWLLLATYIDFRGGFRTSCERGKTPRWVPTYIFWTFLKISRN